MGFRKSLSNIFDLNKSLANCSYSQEGEDIVLKRLFGNKQKGFYIDVGAHHPKRFSNTFLFYSSGWNGINIDPMPGSMRLFDRLRPRDINIEAAISDKNEKLTYYAFDEPALNGFSKDISEARANDTNTIIFTKIIETKTLSEILDKYLAQQQHIDFLSIDVEGLEHQVLKSNNWNKYLPEVVLVELFGFDLTETINSEIYHFLVLHGYHLIAKTINTVFFKLKK